MVFEEHASTARDTRLTDRGGGWIERFKGYAMAYRRGASVWRGHHHQSQSRDSTQKSPCRARSPTQDAMNPTMTATAKPAANACAHVTSGLLSALRPAKKNANSAKQPKLQARSLPAVNTRDIGRFCAPANGGSEDVYSLPGRCRVLDGLANHESTM